MKGFWLLSLVELALLPRRASCTNTPLLPYDPATTSDCADWFNNDEDKTCEWVRDYFRASPEEYSSGNPSVGLDCKPWYNWNSYCVITWTKVNETQMATTSTTATLGPSPTAAGIVVATITPASGGKRDSVAVQKPGSLFSSAWLLGFGYLVSRGFMEIL